MLTSPSIIREVERMREFYNGPLFEAAKSSLVRAMEQYEAAAPLIEQTIRTYQSIFNSPGMQAAMELAETKAQELQKLYDLVSDNYLYDNEIDTASFLKKAQGPKTVVTFLEDRVSVYDSIVKQRKKIAKHTIIIRAFVDLSRNDMQFCTDDQIEDYLRKEDFPPFEGKAKTERIRLGLRDGMRHLRIPKVLRNGKAFAKRVRKVGYVVSNEI